MDQAQNRALTDLNAIVSAVRLAKEHAVDDEDYVLSSELRDLEKEVLGMQLSLQAGDHHRLLAEISRLNTPSETYGAIVVDYAVPGNND